VKQIYDSQGVDRFSASILPGCHRATAVIARALEARGLTTLSMTILWEAGQEVKLPRTCFLWATGPAKQTNHVTLCQVL
jgi:hypothetical protein